MSSYCIYVRLGGDWFSGQLFRLELQLRSVILITEYSIDVSDIIHSVLRSPSLICRLTGFTIPPPVTSSGSIFSLRLTSDFAVSAHGFKVAYEGKNSMIFYSLAPIDIRDSL